MKPKACRFAGIVPKVIGLDYLVGLPNKGRQSTNRVFNATAWNVGSFRAVNEHAGERQGFLHMLNSRAAVGFNPPPRNPMPTASGKISTLRVCNQDIPRGAKHVAHVPLIVRAWRFGRFNIATHGVMTPGDEGVADNSGFFACNKYGQLPHNLHP
jgi:hypothetical protein